ncbi:hypothetical protein FRC12_014012 [Ceratobasidium sp. 428]|nr:hypothetical protein FRC12_014012 [Ceratobasidium sp. 428]
MRGADPHTLDAVAPSRKLLSPESQPNPDTNPNADTNPNPDTQYTSWERGITRKEIIKTLQTFCIDDLNEVPDGELKELYVDFWQDQHVREFTAKWVIETVGKQPPIAQQPEAQADMDVDPPEERKLTPSQRRNRRCRRSKSKQNSPTPSSAPVPSSAGANHLTPSMPAEAPALAAAPAAALAPTLASAQAQAQAPVASTHPDSAGLDADGTATQPTSDDKNGPPPIKPLRKRKLPVTALSPPASNANSEAESENALPPREAVTLRLSYPDKPRPICGTSNLRWSTSQPRPPASQSQLPTSQPCPPRSRPRPPTSQSSAPASQPSQPRQPSEVTEEVPETDPKILAERVPRARPATYSGTRSHIGSRLYPLDPKQAPIDYASWRESVCARPPLNLSAGAGPSNSSIQPVAPTPNHAQSDQSKRKADLAAKGDAAKVTFHKMANPSDPVTDAQRDMIRNGHRRLKAMASTVVGREERKKKRLPARARAGGSSRHTGINAWAHRGDDNNDDDNDKDKEAEDQGDDNNDDENEDENTRHEERILAKSGRSQKPVTNDLKGRVRAAATVAKLLLYLYAVVFGPYLKRETYLLWSELVYKIAWYYVYPKLPFEKPLQIVYILMVNNLASLKCNAKVAGRAILEPVFGLLRPAMTRADINRNLNILQYIYPLRFHCTDARPRTGHFEGLIIPRAIAAILFYGKSLVSVLFHEYLNPIPVITLTCILTVIEFCLSEWMVLGSEGIHTPRKLSQVGQNRMQNMWLSQMENIRRFQANTRGRLNRLSADWFKYAIVYSGASITNDDTTDLQNLFNTTEFRPATPEPDSPPPESHHYGSSLNPHKRRHNPPSNS